jgi:hypothetical protein
MLFLKFTGIEESISAAKNVEALEALIDQMRLAIEESKVGELSGPFWMNNEYSIIIKGPNPDASLNTVEPILKLFPLLRQGCRVTKRYGPFIEGVREETFDLTA